MKKIEFEMDIKIECIENLSFCYRSLFCVVKMNSDCVGKTVSLDCGSLGFFQGIIKGVHLDEQTITIKNVFQNGIPSKMASITLR